MITVEEEQEIKTEAKVDFTGEQLTQVVYRVVSLTRVMQNLLERVEGLEEQYRTGNKGIAYELRNEVTYLHNELYEVQKLIGLHGELPGKKYKYKQYKRYDNEQ